MSNQVYPLSRQQDIVIQEFDDEILIYDLQTNKAFSLNKTSALIWRECDGNKNVFEINQIINKKLNVKADENLVWLAIESFKKENLLTNSEEIAPDFGGLSRREVVKKVGLGTMVALPLIASVIAPTAAMAQSSCVPPTFFDQNGMLVDGGDCLLGAQFPPGLGNCCANPNNLNIACCGKCIDILEFGGDCGATN